MVEQQLENSLWRIVDASIGDAMVGRVEDAGITSVETFEEAGVESLWRGLVISMQDGSKYHLPILKSS